MHVHITINKISNKKKIVMLIPFFSFCFSLYCSMEGSDICFEVVRRAVAGFIYSEAVAG